MQHRLRRRLTDTISDAFTAALQRGDLVTAEELLGVLENMQFRTRVRLQGDRRNPDRGLERSRRELESRKQARLKRV